MFEAMLEQLCRQRPLPGQFQWISSMEGVRVCDFTCALPARLISENETARHYEALFCRQGGLRIDWTVIMSAWGSGKFCYSPIFQKFNPSAR